MGLLLFFLKAGQRGIKFQILRIWSVPIDHSRNYFFCRLDTSRRWFGKNASAIIYFVIYDHPSATLPWVPRTQSSKEKAAGKLNSNSSLVRYILLSWGEIRIYFLYPKLWVKWWYWHLVKVIFKISLKAIFTHKIKLLLQSGKPPETWVRIPVLFVIFTYAHISWGEVGIYILYPQLWVK